MPAPSRADLSRDAYHRWLAAVLAAAAILGFARLGTPAVWLDEASSWYNASGTWAHVWQRAVEGEDTGGILYSVLLKGWIGLAGTSEAAMRAPGILLLLGFVGALARAARLTAGRAAGACTAAVALAHPSVLPAARQARGYILLLTLTALALLAIAHRLSGRRRLPAWLLALASLGAAATHVFGVFVAVGAALCHAAVTWRDGGPRRGVRAVHGLSVALPAVLFSLVWSLLIWDRVVRNLDSFWIPGTLASNYAATALLLLAPLAAAAAWLLWTDRSPRTRLVVFGLALFAVPIAAGPGMVSAWSPGTTHLVMVRYALGLVPLAALAAGIALSRLPSRWLVPLLAVAILASAGYSTSKNVYAGATRNGQDIRGAVAFLTRHAAPGDVLFVEPFNNWLVLEYYGVRTRSRDGSGTGWRVVEAPLAAGAPAPHTTWLVRFSRRTLLGPEVLARVTETRQFGLITVARD